ncbi:polymeric immunoglobulin receptor-like [Sebastes fasciatus]|uniref:polymeric immunoglobulin receptor-like n=1 Tax=Sebastes fasciatus TaxID=394691 RepID=UPI003D9F5CBA
MSGLRTESSGWYWCAKGDLQMPVHVTVIEQLTTGIDSQIVTVRRVSVNHGGSISIPCLYDPRYTDHVKYLCKGYWWPGCSDVVNTSQSHNSGKFSISDDTNQTIFTVTVNDPTDDGSEYWCAVKIDEGSDVKEYFHLSVTRGIPSLYMDKQEIAAFEGGSVTVVCRYEYADVTEWCRLGGSCVASLNGSIDGTKVTINASVPGVFTVTMSELRMESGGWYWCDNGDFQMPVHITVTTTTTTMSPNTANFTETPPNTTQHSSPFTSAQPHTAQPTNSTINGTGGENLQGQHKSSTMVAILTPTLVLLLLMVLAAFIGYRIRRSKTKPEGSDITAGSQIGSDPDVNYATIVHKQHAAAKQKGSPVGSDPDVNYATIVLKQHTAAQQKNKTPEESVTYSTIVMKDSVPQTTEPVDGSVIYSTINAN